MGGDERRARAQVIHRPALPRHAGETERFHTSNPGSYPVGGLKSPKPSFWTKRPFVEGKPYIGLSAGFVVANAVTNVRCWLQSEVSRTLALVRSSPSSRHSSHRLPLLRVEQTRAARAHQDRF
jgi:hypothetical protein